jgi:non-heme chloroperoxidase
MRFIGAPVSPRAAAVHEASSGPAGRQFHAGGTPMPFITTKDGAQLYYIDWGQKDAQPIHFHHGWPLSADDWDNQLMFFLNHGYRVIAHDRRGHGRSEQTDSGNEMDTYASDVADLVQALDLRNAVHVGHSTGGGEVTRYVAQHGKGRVAKAVLIDAVPPVMVKKDSNPGGTPIEVFDGYRAALANNRAQLYLDIPSGPFYGFNRPGATVSEGLIRNWWRQGMMGSVKAGYECIKAFSETDFTEDLKSIDVPVLVIHSEDDQIVPYADSAPLTAMLLKNGTLKTYKDLPHGCCQTHPDLINADLLAFIRGESVEGTSEAPKLVAEPLPA